MKTLGDIRELRSGIWWLICLRLVAVAGVIIATVVARDLKLQTNFTGLYITTAVLLAYNVFFAVLLHHSRGINALRVIANLQIFLDFMSLTILLHFSGGIESPFKLYYVFHTIISAILLSRWEATIQTGLAIVMIGALILMEHAGLLGHWSLGIIPLERMTHPNLYVFSRLFVLTSALLLALYMTISVTERSRQKNVELSTIREQLTRHELPRGEEDILREEKLSSLGRMAAGIAHEINNPLTVILTNVELALEDLDPKSPTHESLQIVNDEVIRCRNIISQLLTFARGEGIGRKLCDAGAILKNAAALIRNYATLNQVSIDMQVPPEPLHCRVNENQIMQLLFNVMLNGIQAMSKGGTLKVAVAACGDQCVSFTIEDTGHGIPRSIISKIFDPFFTTKKSGEGTGLGLSVCHRIVELHHGIIDVQSEEAKGTRFIIRLPYV